MTKFRSLHLKSKRIPGVAAVIAATRPERGLSCTFAQMYLTN